MSVVIETTIGDITIDLFIDERPQTSRNFLKLCKIKYYNWNLFHSVQSNFIAQTGDPTGTGKGGESIYGMVLGERAKYYEAEKMPKIKHDRAGLVSMVNCGSNMLGSQFFITLAAELQSLDGEHCVFGEIVEGLEIILKFNETICDNDHRPYQDIRISHTVILEDPFEDPKGLVIPDRSPEPTREVLMSDRIGADEVIDDTNGMTTEEIMEMQKEKEAKARATILEIVGDIPDADIAPPENVLFVCKLNPVTTDDDLEIIFSRFGKIVGCEVIRDKQTGDSLQYAFIEFADRKSCEDAYFKMDNVLIDDRRIHVDFSQSVAKMKWRGKGKGIKYLDDKEEEKQEYRKENQKNYRRNRNDEEEEIRKGRKDESSKAYHNESIYKKYEDKEKNQRTNRDSSENDRNSNREYKDKKYKYYKTHHYDYKRDNEKDKEREKKRKNDSKHNHDRDRSRGSCKNRGNRSTKSRSRSRSMHRSRSKIKNKKKERSSSRNKKYYK